MAVVLPKVHQPALAPFIRDDLLTKEDMEKIKGLLLRNRALDLASGRVPGSALLAGALDGRSGSQSATGYDHVWVRDNVFLAFSLCETDDDGDGTAQAIAIVRDLAKFFMKTASRFDEIIAGRADPQDAMSRPHMRFKGQDLDESPEPWNHKQNDAIGYWMWLRCRLCVEGKMPMTGDHLRLLGLMLEYLMKIEFWRDEDGGHWEEGAKVRASSIGPVVAAAKEFQKLLQKYPGMMVPCADGTLDAVEKMGDEALEQTLPRECIQEGKVRDVDSALLFLIYPLDIVSKEMARTIVKSVQEQLMGAIGVRRYNGDRFWCKDYEVVTGTGKEAVIDDEVAKTGELVLPGEEAQSCLFDSIISVIYGRWYEESQDFEDLTSQQQHLFRSLAQITGPDCPAGPWLVPQCFYIASGNWVPNDICPFLWSQANLQIALRWMDKSIDKSQFEIKKELKTIDGEGVGNIQVDDLVTVFRKLNADLPVDEITSLLGEFCSDGNVCFDKLVEGLFCGTVTKPAQLCLNLKGINPPQDMSPDEAQEAERVLTDALLELHGEFEGEYFPLPGSQSFPARMGGMTSKEAKCLEAQGLLFQAVESMGRGVFANAELDVAVLVNGESHAQIVVKPPAGDNDIGTKRVARLEQALRDAVKSSGYDFD
uniref:GH15-like domain-containing protein n=1 Tax=Zooxanthella nutricula TaxID=1333877 RepID=A0A7S2QI09_9DINO